MVANSKDEVSSYEIQQTIGVTQKTAWFMMRRVRHAMQTGTFEGHSGKAEIDGSFARVSSLMPDLWATITGVASFRLSSRPVKGAPQGGEPPPRSAMLDR